MKYGFSIKSLSVRGVNCKDADLDFSENVTVVAGLSNTGKSYVFQCLKYLLGSNDAPKKINESKGYDKAFIELRLSDGSFNTVYRSLSGGGALLYLCSLEELISSDDDPEVLSTNSKATQKHRTLSDYYCSLSGLKDKKVRKNADGNSEKLGFSLMRHLSVIDEVDIIKEGSPILSGQYIHETKEKSFLKFLLSGEDDSSIVAKPKANVVNNRKGKLEVVEAFIREYQGELEEYSDISLDDISEQEKKLGLAIEVGNFELSILFESVEVVESTVNDNWQLWKEKESRLLTVEELLIRFNLLAQHYETDMARLEAINEAGNAFSQLDLGNCPVCLSGFKDEHLCNIDNVNEVVVASEGEMSKIQSLKKDLQFNLDNLYQERAELFDEINHLKNKHKLAQESLNLCRSVEIKSIVNSIESLRVKLRDLKNIKSLQEKLQKLKVQHSEYQSEINPANEKYQFNTLSTALMTEVSSGVKSLLKAWQYDEMESVSYSEDSVDLVINGNDRNLSGKGYRALTYSSLIISILKYCVTKGKPHSGVVILDSPLCTLRSKHVDLEDTNNDGDIIGDEMKDSFYHNLSMYHDAGQVIVFENDGPNSIASQKFKYHKFTKGRTPGRYGFFPIS